MKIRETLVTLAKAILYVGLIFAFGCANWAIGTTSGFKAGRKFEREMQWCMSLGQSEEACAESARKGLSMR